MTGETFFQLHYHLTDTERLFDLAQGIAARRRWLKKHDARCRSFTWYARGLLRRGIAFLILAAVLLASLRQIRPENLLPGAGLPDGWLLVALLLPGGGRRQGWLWALAFCLTAAGVGWVGENAFLLLSRSASGMGSARRLESLAAVGLALSFFLMMTQLLSQEHPGDRIWSAALAAALFLGGFRINGWLAALCAATAWYFLPTMCEKRKIKDKNSK